MVERLYPLLPKDAVLLLNPLGSFLGIGLLPVKLAAPDRPDLYFRDWEVLFPRFREIARRAIEQYQGMPFFAPHESPERRYLDARELDATHVLADPASRDVMMAAVSARPDLFEPLLDHSGWLLLAVRPAAQPLHGSH